MGQTTPQRNAMTSDQEGATSTSGAIPADVEIIDPDVPGSGKVYQLKLEQLDRMGNPKNPRKPMKGHKFEALKDMHRKFGPLQAVVVNVRTGFVVGGHQRIKAAIAVGFKIYPTVFVDRSETEEAEANVGLNGTSGEWDDDLLKEMLGGISKDPLGDLGLTGFNESELAAILDDPSEGKTPDDALPEESEKRCSPGDLWILGEHRLVCGDVTNEGDVDKLMDGEKADFVFTDPPYGVNVTGKGGKAIEGDISFTAIPLFFDMMDRVLAEKCWVYVCGGQSNMLLYSKMFERYFRELPRIIIWDKGNTAVMRANGYHSCFEILYYSFRGGSGSWWFSGRKSDDADDIWRQSVEHGKARVHPTQKPVEIPHRAIANTCPPDGIVWEPFGGSGSTLIAAEKLSRRCFAMEISPEYCDVIIARWEEFTGLKAHKGSGEAS